GVYGAAHGVHTVLATREVQPLDGPPSADLDGDVAEVADGHRDDLAEAQGDDGEIIPSDAERRRADQGAEHRGHRGGDPDAQPETPRVAVERRAQHRRVQQTHRVGPDGEEGRVAQVEQPRVADHDVEPEGEEDVNHPVRDRVDGLKSEGAVDERIREHERDEQDHAQRAPRLHADQTFSGVRSPRRPWGRNTRTRMRIENTIALVHRADMY